MTIESIPSVMGCLHSLHGGIFKRCLERMHDYIETR